MKTLYWRPQTIALRVLVVMAGFAVSALVGVEVFQIKHRLPHHKTKMRAAQQTAAAFESIAQEKAKRGLLAPSGTDPTQTGMVGALLTHTTTNPGHLPAKLTSQNPNFAAVAVHLLLRAGAQRGQPVAIGVSGSFPAINIAVITAAETLGLRPVLISSAGSSQWGANQPSFLWPDMEAHLADQGLLRTRSVKVSLGGINDQALGLNAEGRALIEQSIKRNGYQLLNAPTFQASVAQRMALYETQVDDLAAFAAYINVGGGTTSVGTRLGKRRFKPGLNRTLPRGAAAFDSVMTRFAQAGVPVIHFVKIDQLATRYGLPLQPTEKPIPGQGRIFVRAERSRGWAAGALLTLLLLLWALVRRDWGYRVLSPNRAHRGPTQPTHMV